MLAAKSKIQQKVSEDTLEKDQKILGMEGIKFGFPKPNLPVIPDSYVNFSEVVDISLFLYDGFNPKSQIGHLTSIGVPPSLMATLIGIVSMRSPRILAGLNSSTRNSALDLEFIEKLKTPFSVYSQEGLLDFLDKHGVPFSPDFTVSLFDIINHKEYEREGEPNKNYPLFVSERNSKLTGILSPWQVGVTTPGGLVRSCPYFSFYCQFIGEFMVQSSVYQVVQSLFTFPEKVSLKEHCYSSVTYFPSTDRKFSLFSLALSSIYSFLYDPSVTPEQILKFHSLTLSTVPVPFAQKAYSKVEGNEKLPIYTSKFGLDYKPVRIEHESYNSTLENYDYSSSFVSLVLSLCASKVVRE